MAKNRKGIYIRVTDEEYAELLRQKNFMNLPSYSDLVRMYINNAICFNVDFNGLFEVAAQIARIGNNINQIARVANESNDITPQQIEILMKHMNEIDTEVSKVSKAKANITKYIARETTEGGNLGNYENYKSKQER